MLLEIRKVGIVGLSRTYKRFTSISNTTSIEGLCDGEDWQHNNETRINFFISSSSTKSCCIATSKICNSLPSWCSLHVLPRKHKQILDCYISINKIVVALTISKLNYLQTRIFIKKIVKIFVVCAPWVLNFIFLL